MNTHRKIAVVIGMIAVFAASLLAAMGAGASHGTLKTYPRSQTLYTSGSWWMSVNVGFNPYLGVYGTYATGTVGLAYETLLRYDPIRDKYINWLAKRYLWTKTPAGKDELEVTVRSGIKWFNGKKFTASDVAWNINLGRFSSAKQPEGWHSLYASLLGPGPGSARAKASGNTVTLVFKTTPRYQEWMHLLWNLPMVNPTQWASVTNSTLNTFLTSGNPPASPIGTGPYALDRPGYDSSAQVAWKKNKQWWACRVARIAPCPEPAYIVDRVNINGIDPTTILSRLISGDEDLSNRWVPSLPTILAAHPDLHTYEPAEPYHLSANTVWLVPNTAEKPLNDPQFRRAMAYAINVAPIIAYIDQYDGQVRKASPTGLPPTQATFIDSNLVSSYGFSFDAATARSILNTAGYHDVNSDGLVENQDGSKIALTLTVPISWGDWEYAAALIARQLRNVGISVAVPSPLPNYSEMLNARKNGTYDLQLDSGAQLSDTPWTTYDYLFRYPVNMQNPLFNVEHYGSPSGSAADRHNAILASGWTNKLDKIPRNNAAAMRAVIRKVQKLELTQLPAIPLYYNGLWSEFSSKCWANWPSSSAGSGHAVPAMGRGYLNMTGIDMIDHLKPVSGC